jgi:hypothetical protein
VDFESAVESVFALHAARARMAGKVQHRNSVEGAPDGGLRARGRPGAVQGRLARVHLAEHQGRAVAGLVVLSDGDTDYLSLSGLEPRYWDLNLNTLLVWEALIRSAEQGRSAMNLSAGPDVAKLRWSRELVLFQDFAVVRPASPVTDGHTPSSHTHSSPSSGGRPGLGTPPSRCDARAARRRSTTVG